MTAPTPMRAPAHPSAAAPQRSQAGVTACVSSRVNSAPAAQSAGAASWKGTRLSEDDEQVLRMYMAEQISRSVAATMLGCSPSNVSTLVGHRRKLAADAMAATVHGVPPGEWVPIAHKTVKTWKPIAGAPCSIDEARAATDAGLLLMAQRRVEGGFDLCVRARG